MSSRNPFEDDDDEFSFASHARKTKALESSRGGGGRPYVSTNPFEDDDGSSIGNNSYSNPSAPRDALDSKQMLIQNSINRQLESTTRCLASIYDSEAIGIATAEELVNQGEKLDNAERNVDKIIVNTKTSQKHLNSIKSVFGGLKNWWSGDPKKDSNLPATTNTRDRSNTTLGKAISVGGTSGRDTHPAVRDKGYDVKGFYDTDVVEFKDYDQDSFIRSRTNNRMESLSSPPTIEQKLDPWQQQTRESSSRSKTWDDYEKGLDTNLGLMAAGLGNLKMLAKGLGEEIETQNEQLDRITEKVDRSDTKVRNQNMQMKRILGK